MMNTQMKSKETAIQTRTLKRPLPVFYAEIKDENSCPTAANVRLSTHTYIHKCVHRQTHLSCKCRIITVLSEGAKLGCLLKIAMLKRSIDVRLGNGGETQGDTELVSLTLSLSASKNPNILRLSGQWCVFVWCEDGRGHVRVYNEAMNDQQHPEVKVQVPQG